MNKHTVDLKRAKKLKELGWEKETLFWWESKRINGISRWDVYRELPSVYPSKFSYSAPIASELLKELPDFVTFGKAPRTGGKRYYADYIHKKDNNIYADTPVKALADMWIYLKEEGLI